jgi:hypothetical protein
VVDKGGPRMAAPPRKHRLGTEQRRALQLLASSPFGATEAILLPKCPNNMSGAQCWYVGFPPELPYRLGDFQGTTSSALGQNEPCHSLRRRGRSTSVNGRAGGRPALPGRAKSRHQYVRPISKPRAGTSPVRRQPLTCSVPVRRPFFASFVCSLKRTPPQSFVGL